MKKTIHSAVISLGIIVFVTYSAQANTNAYSTINVAISTLGDKGIHGFAELLLSQNFVLYPIQFDGCTDKEYELGEKLLECSEGLASAHTIDLSELESLIKVEQWVHKKEGVRNLVLSYNMQKTARRVLARLIKKEPRSWNTLTNQISQLMTDDPDGKYWLAVAHNAWPQIVTDTIQDTALPDYQMLTKIVGKVAVSTQHATMLYQPPNVRQTRAQGIFACPDNYLLAMDAALNAADRIALEVIIEILKEEAKLPISESDFIATAKRVASPVLHKRDRLGGRVFADDVWSVWSELSR